MSKATRKNVHRVENKELARGMRMLAFSNAAGTHQNKGERRARTRGASTSRAIRHNGW